MYIRALQRKRRFWYSLCGFLTAVLLWAHIPTVSAEYIGDCAVMLDGTSSANKILGSYAQDNTVVDSQTLTLALKSLWHYCCAYSLLDPENAGCKETKELKWWADSPYLFDHLLDISYRRLDANEDSALRYGLPSDDKWSERQKKLTELGNPDNKITPSAIQQAYAANRTLGSTPFVSSDTCSISSNIQYSTLTIDQRYAVACMMASCIAEHAPKATSNLTDASRASTTSNLCPDIYKQRINQETDYVRQLQVRVGIRNVTNILQQYTQNYFIDTRRSMLYDEITNVSQNLTFVNRKVQEWTPACSGK